MILLLSSLLVFALTLFAWEVSAKDRINVSIEGVDGKILDNVEATLKIFQLRNSPSLTDRKIKQLHSNAGLEIEQALEPYGYYSPEIQTSLMLKDEIWNASYRISKGQPVRLENIEFSLDSMEDISKEIELITRNFPIGEGGIIDHGLYAQGKKRILRQLYGLGFLDAEFISSEILVQKKLYSAQIKLHLRTGQRYKFGTTASDQEIIDSDLLQKFTNFNKGDNYSQRKLLELQRVLYRTNYFGQVIVRGETEKAEGLEVPIKIDLLEPEFYNKYSFGLGYATDNGFRGKIGWSNRLLNRSGHTLSSELQIGERESSMIATYSVPVNNPRYDKLLYGVSYDDESWETTDIKLFKAGVSYIHAGPMYRYGGGFEIRDEKYEIGSTDGESFLPVPKLNWSMVIADDVLSTKNGIFISMDLRAASEDVFGDTTFAQGILSGKLITSPFSRFRLIGRFSVGGNMVDDIEDLPPSLRFYAGGDQSVRGYGYRELGPQDAAGNVLGGKYLLFGSIEAEQKLSGGWSVAAFFDSGNGVNQLSDDLKEGVGVGVRYRLPFGQIKLDVASAISEDDNPLRLHLTVGGDL